MILFRYLLAATLLAPSATLLAHHEASHDASQGAHHDNHSSIEVSQAWTRATPPGASSGGGFMTITNHTDSDDRLVDAASPLTERVEIHTMEMDDDVMRMRHLPDGIEIAAGDSVELAPGGLHLMFMELSSGIEEHQPVAVTLTFEHAGEIEVELDVVPPGASPGNGHHHDHDHEHDHDHGEH